MSSNIQNICVSKQREIMKLLMTLNSVEALGDKIGEILGEAFLEAGITYNEYNLNMAIRRFVLIFSYASPVFQTIRNAMSSDTVSMNAPSNSSGEKFETKLISVLTSLREVLPRRDISKMIRVKRILRIVEMVDNDSLSPARIGRFLQKSLKKVVFSDGERGNSDEKDDSDDSDSEDRDQDRCSPVPKTKPSKPAHASTPAPAPAPASVPSPIADTSLPPPSAVARKSRKLVRAAPPPSPATSAVQVNEVVPEVAKLPATKSYSEVIASTKSSKNGGSDAARKPIRVIGGAGAGAGTGAGTGAEEGAKAGVDANTNTNGTEVPAIGHKINTTLGERSIHVRKNREDTNPVERIIGKTILNTPALREEELYDLYEFCNVGGNWMHCKHCSFIHDQTNTTVGVWNPDTESYDEVELSKMAKNDAYDRVFEFNDCKFTYCKNADTCTRGAGCKFVHLK
jgi:hypothetical protein